MKNSIKITALLLMMSFAFNTFAQEDNTLSKKEKRKDWILMFDGETTDGWRRFGNTDVPGVWSAKDGTLMCRGVKRDDAKPGEKGLIIYDEKFSNFHLKLDWKISECGNSGIFYLGQEEGYPSIIQTAPEMQVLDNTCHPDAKKGKNGNRQAGSLYDLIPATPQNAKPAGEWNSAEIIVKNGKVTHIQNGKKVVQYKLWTDEWKELVSESKFPKIRENWHDVPKEGYIGLQDHNDDVWYKNIKIRKL
ncbi:MAG: 3-keto-disaccharide hydrolase [Prolixibacteraceae bacterium]